MSQERDDWEEKVIHGKEPISIGSNELTEKERRHALELAIEILAKQKKGDQNEN